MNGYRFYEEFESPRHKRKGESLGTVIAVAYDKSAPYQGAWFDGVDDWSRNCLSSVMEGVRHGVSWSSCSDGYLREKCKRISEAKARELHPEIFRALDTKE